MEINDNLTDILVISKETLGTEAKEKSEEVKIDIKDNN